MKRGDPRHCKIKQLSSFRFDTRAGFVADDNIQNDVPVVYTCIAYFKIGHSSLSVSLPNVLVRDLRFWHVWHVLLAKASTTHALPRQEAYSRRIKPQLSSKPHNSEYKINCL